MLEPALLVLALTAAPPIAVEDEVPGAAAALAASAWDEIERRAAADGLAPPAAPRAVRLRTSARLPPGVAASSRPGVVEMRAGLFLGSAGIPVLRHEMAHQFLFAACPAASGDRLFHEAFAVAASGELAAWRPEGGRYLPLARALALLSGGARLDSAGARRALARALSEVEVPPGRLPPALARRLAACEAGTRWELLRPEELASDRAPAADALVVVSRHSGEVLKAEGAVRLPLPFGSTLKPFLVAGAEGETPVLAPDRGDPAWRCGEAMPGRMDAAQALLRSCNGWFLAWAAEDARVVTFGRWGPALLELGLSGLPSDASEAIGVRPRLHISALGLAQAYRLLAEARPDLLDVLSRNAREGTLSRLGASDALRGVALKTGTVLDPEANPRLGWIAAVDDDVVVVMARAGMPPRAFAHLLAGALGEARAPARAAARVQVFGLVAAGEVQARCPGHGFALAPSGPVLLEDLEVPLLERSRAGPLACAGGPWLVRLPGAWVPRPYAGVFSLDPAPSPLAASPGTAREMKARRGSDLVFRTTRLLYAAGVAAAEDASLKGEARVALARVADCNARHSPHRGRAVCDTTHCQVFQGTPAPLSEDRRALAAPLGALRWLPFARGGDEPWHEERSVEAVEAVLGRQARAYRFASGRVLFLASSTDGKDLWEEERALPCEALRGPLKLPSCPNGARVANGRVLFEGRGVGHGEGLDVEWAKRSGLGADEILERAYGLGAPGP